MSTTATRRGSHPRPKGRSQQVQDDTEEVRNLRAKYSDKLEMIRELFPTWTDEDLLFALQDALGDVELVVVRISDGLVEQFSSVKSKKQSKKETTAPNATSAPRSAPASSDAPASTRPARGNHVSAASDRGGRGRGGASVRGARGGRGGFRGVGGRGGGIAPQANGHDYTSPEESTTTPKNFSSIATPTSGTSWAAALGRSNKANGATSEPYASAITQADTPVAEPTSNSSAARDNGASVSASALANSGLDTNVPASTPAPVQVSSESATTTATLSSAVQETQPAVKVPASFKSVPKGSTMSWAQIARKSEAPKPTPVPQSVEAPLEATSISESMEAPAETAAAADPEATEMTLSSAPVEEVEAPALSADEPSAIEPEAVSAPHVEPIERASGPDEADPTTLAAGPPGLSKTSRGASQRTSQRARQDAPVVMAGGSSQLDKLGVQFGSLNFLGADDDEPAEPTSEVVQSEQTPDASASAASPPGSRTQPALHERLSQSQPAQDSYGQQQGQYNGYKSDAFDSSYGFTGQAQQQPSAVSQHQGPQDHAQGYNGFNSIGHGASQNQPQPQQGLQDYSSMYGGLDTQRLAQFYGAYDQNSNAFGHRSDDKSQQQQSSQPGDQHTPQQQHPQGPQAGPGLHHQQAPQQQQQQFPGIMPYYYPHYYMPNQFQHYGQPGGGYGQYPVAYGQPAAQPQHPSSKPGTPANVASPYNQGGPQGDANSYGAQSQYGHQTPSSANVSAYDQGFARNNMQGGAPSLGGMSDYSKIYGGGGLPGLGGFLGSSGSGAPTQTGGAGNGGSGASGTPNMSSQQKVGGASSASALDSYRQYDANAGKSSGQTGGASQSGRGQGQSQSVPQQHQAQPHQQQQQQQQAQQQQQYYQQYGAYGHQGNSSAYSNYPYARQYWGQ